MKDVKFNHARATGGVIGKYSCIEAAAQSGALWDTARKYVDMYDMAGIMSWAMCVDPKGCVDWEQSCLNSAPGWDKACELFGC